MNLTAAAAFLITFAGAFALAPPLIKRLHALKYGQLAYEDAPKSHQKKSGTPTMGGLLFLIAPLVLLAFDQSRSAIGLAVLVFGMALIGFLDDYLSIKAGRNRGLRARQKFLATALIAAVFLWIVGGEAFTGACGLKPLQESGLYWFGHACGLAVPLWFWWALGILAITGSTHAVNLTDGLDGLAAGTIVPPLLVLFLFAQLFAGTMSVATLCAASLGALGAFLIFNRHPARVFMGDTGSLALGGLLAGTAIVSGATLIVPIIGAVFVAEALSVMIQVASFKMTRRRVFRMSPLHHHFELGGWPETKVTRRFWTASFAASAFAIVLALVMRSA